MVNKSESVFRDIYNYRLYGDTNKHRISLSNNLKGSVQYLQRLELHNLLKVHQGCVNTISWNATGQYILSGSDDQSIVITNPYNGKVLMKYKTAHRSNVFSAKFMPDSNDAEIVSCSGDGIVLYTELLSKQGPNAQNIANLNYFNCHSNGTTYDVLTVPTERKSFMSCGEDGTVRLFDLRKISSCHKTCCKDNILILCPAAATAMTLAQTSNNYIAVGSSDSHVRIYDRRYLSLIDFSIPGEPYTKHTLPVKAFTIPSIIKRPFRVTSVNFSSDESELLVNYSSDYIYLFDITKEGVDVKSIYKQPEITATSSNRVGGIVNNIKQPVRRLRLRGDWSDTGPEARPESDGLNRVSSQVRPQLQATIMSRMTEVLTRMLSDPRIRLSFGQYDNEISHTNDIVHAVNEVTTENEPVPPVQQTHHVTQAIAGPSRPYPTLTNHLKYSNIINNSYNNNSNSNNDNSNNNTNSNNENGYINNKDDDDDDDDDDDSNDNGEDENDNYDKRKINRKKVNQQNISGTNTELNILNDIDINETVKKFSYLNMKYVGHRNARTMIKEAAFWGNDHVMSGSDCGHVFTWERKTGKLVMLLEADKHVVNCIQPHPTLPYLATSGIDYDIKIWAPMKETICFDEEVAEELVERNAIMLEQTKDTITVPAAFMIRMLACIHSVRNRRNLASTGQQTDADGNNAGGSNNNNNNNRNDDGHDNDGGAAGGSNGADSNDNDTSLDVTLPES